MPVLKKSPRMFRGVICTLSVDEIVPNPTQPRKRFSQESLRELADSIELHGVLNPLTVRRAGGHYELVAGERRLRAARLAGLSEVPCMILDVSCEESTLLALVENIQRRDLDFIEEAEGIFQLIKLYGMSQEEAARRLGKSQPAIANKLRLLKLPPEVLDILREEELTERHGRALLRLEDPSSQINAARFIARQQMNVAAAEAYIESLLLSPARPAESEGRRKTLFVLKDVRVFLNSLTRSLDLMKQGGIDAGMEKHETDSELVLTISIPKQR